jgi:hypothetical protein
MESGSTLDVQSGTTITLGDLTATELAYLDGITIGQTLDSKCWVMDATGKIDVASGDTLNIDGTFSIANTTVDATADQLDYTVVTAIGQSEDSKALVLDGSGVIDIASGDTLNVDGTLSIGDTAVTSTAKEINQLDVTQVAGVIGGGAMQVVSRLVSTAEINAGHVLVTGVAGRTLTVHGYRFLQAGDGTGGTAIGITVEDTNSSPVAIAVMAKAGLTDGAVISNNLVVANVTDSTPLALTAAKGIRIIKTSGDDLATMTGMTATIYYTVSDA